MPIIGAVFRLNRDVNTKTNRCTTVEDIREALAMPQRTWRPTTVAMIAGWLAELELFRERQLTRTQLMELVYCLTTKTYLTEGCTIFSDSELSHCFYIVLRGVVTIREASPLDGMPFSEVNQFGPGQLFGDDNRVDAGKRVRRNTAVTATPVVVACIRYDVTEHILGALNDSVKAVLDFMATVGVWACVGVCFVCWGRVA